ncbi:Nif3-like dinuclear metal center hexameric protein [Arcticibacterium luteifluviistationis]|uniref:GTP cyclohydrolase 1 type 2 homolog n=1 Tax=Arcticibacterium luteifluviistationis TaxID=1784714 RepID=A0A2Z4G9V3_9BACT|nr:Nif3-like dinuclear metal center hexameric protein [Arcticibacterium luteifluviistationis]AWV97838.1 Nif3-like dinuclear metal center hexameric protein [Arcticibacterium luteifluviistationis]
MQIKELVDYLEAIAPLDYQESYDNSGLIVGDKSQKITNVLVCLDSTEDVIDEAIEKNCNLIIAHHPIIFKGLKKLTGKNYIERTIIKAIKNDIAIYACHTNLDNITGGVSFKMAEKLQLKNVKILAPKKELLLKLTVFVPKENTGQLLDALYAAGAGEIGNYSNCSFRTIGKGTFKANDMANPVIGKRGVYEEVEESRIEVIFPKQLKRKVLKAMKAGHPYEEVSYFLHELENELQLVGSGAIGTLEEPVPVKEFMSYLKTNMALSVIKHTDSLQNDIQTVALCGGSGGFLLKNAIAAKADIFITSDYKYHEYFDADKKIVIADIGHYESEQFTKELIRDEILKKFANFATYLSQVKTNPINYFY